MKPHRPAVRLAEQYRGLVARRGRRSGAALYATVVILSLIVAVLSLAGMHLVGVERRTSQSMIDVANARQYSLAAARLALLDIWNDPSWRGRYSHGVETTHVTFGSGTVSWSLTDTTDNSLSDDADDPVEIRGYGRCGGATWVTSVTVNVVLRDVGPMELQGFPDATSMSNNVVNASHFAGNYFKPFLPSTANYWRVTGVDIWAAQDGTAAGSTNVSLYLPGTSGNPASTLIDDASVPEALLPGSLQAVHLDYTSNSRLDPNVGLSLVLTSTSSTNTMRYGFKTGVMTGTSRYLEGTPGWGSPSSTKSLVFRVYGIYSLRDLAIAPGSWKRVAAN